MRMPQNYSLISSQTKRQKFEILRMELTNERSSFIPMWRDAGDFVFPRRPRFFVQDTNRGDRRNQKIIDTTATLAARTLRSGMMGGITSPARPWFRLTTPDPALADFGPVKDWLYTVTHRMTTIFLRSNIYQVLPLLYGDMSVFATSPILIEEDFDSVIRAYSFPVGSYMIANDYRGKVCVFFREFRMTIRQMIQKFGVMDNGKIDWSKFSLFVRNIYERGNQETWIDICHVIMPNVEHNPRMLHSKYKKFSSTYYERGFQSGTKSNYMSTSQDEDVYLRESGYDYFPALCGRWEITGEDSYGTDCPAFTAIGDIKQLQAGEKKGAQAIDKMVNPAMQGPTALRGQKISLLPGDTTFIDLQQGQQGFKPTHEVNPKIKELEEKQAQIRSRIDRAFFKDLFQMFENEQSGVTATEINARQEEKLVVLGPVLEQLNQDVLDPMIDVTFSNMMAQGWVPPPPKELSGMPLRIEYISIMAQAQKVAGIGGLERFTNFVGGLIKATGDTSVLAKINQDELINVYGDLTSVPPLIIRSDDEAKGIRDEQAKAQQAAQMPQQAKDATAAAQNLGNTPMDQDSALTRLLKQSQAGQLAPTNASAPPLQ